MSIILNLARSSSKRRSRRLPLTETVKSISTTMFYSQCNAASIKISRTVTKEVKYWKLAVVKPNVWDAQSVLRRSKLPPRTRPGPDHSHCLHNLSLLTSRPRPDDMWLVVCMWRTLEQVLQFDMSESRSSTLIYFSATPDSAKRYLDEQARALI